MSDPSSCTAAGGPATASRRCRPCSYAIRPCGGGISQSHGHCRSARPCAWSPSHIHRTTSQPCPGVALHRACSWRSMSCWTLRVRRRPTWPSWSGECAVWWLGVVRRTPTRQ